MDAEKAARLRQIIERAKRDLVSRFDLLQAAMRGEFMSTIYSSRVPSAKAQSDFEHQLSELGEDASRTERAIAKSVNKEIHAIVGWVESPKMVENLFVFQTDIIRQIRRDAKAITYIFRQFQTTLNGISKDKYMLAKAQALQHITKSSVFTFKDKAGKIWDTKVYLKTYSSQYYYGLANDLAIGSIFSEERKEARLDRPGHKSDGLEIHMSKVDSKFRSKYLHPGSQGILV